MNPLKVPRPYDNKENYKTFRFKHDRDKGAEINEKRRDILSEWKQRWPYDGLNVSFVTSSHRTFMFDSDSTVRCCECELREVLCQCHFDI